MTPYNHALHVRELASFWIVLFLVGCAGPRPQSSELPETHSASERAQPRPVTVERRNLEREEVLKMAMDYAQQQQWDIKKVWSGMPVFDEARQVWRVFINTKQNGGPMIVSIKDSTKEISFTRGE